MAKSYIPIIFGLEGPTLSQKEKEFFEKSQPLGFILFQRNCITPQQVQELVHDLRSLVDHHAPILIDQEGGRIVRLTPPHWPSFPPASLFGDLMAQDPQKAKIDCKINAINIAQTLKNLGIDVNCAPALDLFFENADPIIGDRSFSPNSEYVGVLGKEMISAFQSAGVTPIIKHLPGHGRAPVDSHKALPIVSASLQTLEKTDFKPFQDICSWISEHNHEWPWGMTAHVVYSEIDPQPATYSPVIIQNTIRDYIGFKGFLVSDCLTMKALDGPYAERAQRALQAGCDAVLHCNGYLKEMEEIAAALLQS